MSLSEETDVGWAERLASEAAKPHANETSLRYALYAVLRPYLTDVVGLAEADIHHEGTGESGRYDSLFGRLLIEYKAPGELDSDSKRKRHASQAVRYLRDEGIGADIVILTDGLIWGILRDSVGPDPGEQGWLEFDMPAPVSDAELFQWRPNSPAAAQRVLDLIDTVRTVPVSTASIVSHLGPRRAEAQRLLATLASALKGRAAGSRTDILFRQWLDLAGVSYGISAVDSPWPRNGQASVLEDLANTLGASTYPEAIFTLHTYIAYCSKIIAAETLALAKGDAEVRPSQWTAHGKNEFHRRVAELESGAIAERLGATGLMGGDIFGWYAPVILDNPELDKAVRDSIASFAELGWARLAHAATVTGDLLRGFYTAVMPRQMRKALGEFFTPEWLAERVLMKSLSLLGTAPSEVIRILDPSCGSGTFLVAAIRRTLRAAAEAGQSREQQTQTAISSVYGFDINPVSPLMARVNLLLALGDRVSDLPTVAFHVYQADSILIPEEHAGELTLDQAGTDLRVPLVIGNIMLPQSLANVDAISALAQVANQSLERNRAVATFRQRLQPALSTAGISAADMTECLDAAAKIYNQLYALHAEGRNGIWAHVIEQSFAPRVIHDVDLVIGNPPWISWKHLPEAWQQRSEPVWTQWGLWQRKKQGKGTPMSDISTLLLARSLATYAPDGIVALLVPEGILINEPGGRAIRKSVLKSELTAGQANMREHPYRTLHVDDFSTLKPFADAANHPIAIYMRSGEEASFPFPATAWTRAAKRTSLSATKGWASISAMLVADEHELGPLDPKDPASRWRRPDYATGRGLMLRSLNSTAEYVWGQGFHTRGADGIFYCEVISHKPLPGKLVRIRTRPDIGRNTKNLPSEETLVEAQFLWPLLRGRDVDPFHVRSSGLYCIVPHDPNKLTSILKVDELIKEAPRLYDYLEQHLDQLKGRSAYDMEISDERPWGIQGTAWRHMRPDRYLVVSRYMHPEKMPPAAVCSPEMRAEIGRTTTVYPNNKVNFVACASCEEADFVAAYVNSGPAQRAIARQCASTTIGPNAMNALPIPKFAASDGDHRRLSALGALCRQNAEHRTQYVEEIDALALTVTAASD